MNKILPILFCMIALCGCQKTQEWGEKMGLRQKPEQMMEGSNYYNFPEISPGKQYKSENTFCYKVQTDILCYDQPRKGWEDRLVGYQEPLRRVERAAPRPMPQYQNNYQNPTPIQQSPLAPLPQTNVPAVQPVM